MYRFFVNDIGVLAISRLKKKKTEANVQALRIFYFSGIRIKIFVYVLGPIKRYSMGTLEIRIPSTLFSQR